MTGPGRSAAGLLAADHRTPAGAERTTADDQEFTGWLAGLRSWAARLPGDAAAWRAAGGQGVLSLAVPEAAGGTAAGYRSACLAVETIAEASGRGGFPFAMSAQMWACQEPIVAFGTAAQTAQLAGLLSGELVGAFAATEYDAGSDLLSMRTTASREGDGGWRLDGAKTFVTNGPIAGLYLVLARCGPGGALGGLTAFLVPRGTPGLQIGPAMPTTALSGAQLGSLQMDACALADSARLGPVGGGFAVLMHAMRYERAFILAPTIGLMARALRDAMRHVRSRRQGGLPLSAYDTIRQRIVRMHLRLTSAKEVLYATATAADRGVLDHQRASLTKLHVSTEFNGFCTDLPDVYGGYAVLRDTGTADLIADAVASRYYSGTADMQMKIIAEGLGL
jgi:alkylation response protein AidB-like acyl-CoA dehydrogenase